MSQYGLTTPEERVFLQNSACLHDTGNNGMSRKEAIDIIIELCGDKETIRRITTSNIVLELDRYLTRGQVVD